MAGIKNTTVVHGNHGFMQLDGTIIGRVKNVTMDWEGSPDLFFEMGSAHVQDIEVINKSVNVSIERGAVDYLLLAYAVGARTVLGQTASLNEGDTNFLDLVIDENANAVLTLSNSTQVLVVPIIVDIILNATKVNGISTFQNLNVTARDCKIIRSSIVAPNSAYWTANMNLVGKQITVGGISVPQISG